MSAVASFPKVLMVTRFEDAGEFGGTKCPHCGADCRYVRWFVCDDGVERGAASTCFSLYPKSPLAAAASKVYDKVQQRRKLNGWDTAKLDAFEALRAGRSTEAEVSEVCRRQDAQRRAWLDKRYGGRR